MASSKKAASPISDFLDFLDGLGIASWVILVPVFTIACLVAIATAPPVVVKGLMYAGVIVLIAAPFVAPYILFFMANDAWLHWKRDAFILKEGSILLEILLPREIYKSPQAMEIALMQMHLAMGSNWLETYKNGKVRLWYSFEMASFGGEIHFYIWTWPRAKDIVESQLYAQYPGIQIIEVKDYTEGVTANPEQWETWSTHFILGNKDAYPIKTYIDYGMDKNEKEEYKIDPMAAVIEFMGSLKQGEQIWLQILARPHKKVSPSEGTFRSEPEWTAEIDEEIATIKEKATTKMKVGDREMPGFPNLTKGQAETIAALERSKDKLAYEVMIRGVYVAKPGSFVGAHIPGMLGSFRQYSSKNLNSFRPAGLTDFDYPWQDFWGYRVAKMKRMNLDAYKQRAFFYGQYHGIWGLHHYILTVEELATIFHFPGVEVGTPSLPRIPSVAGEAPPNLPI